MKPISAAPLAVALIFVLLVALSGCDAPYVRQFYDQFRADYGWNEERTLNSGWMPSGDAARDPVYCYRTLADSDCYATPQKVPEGQSKE